MKLNYNKDIKGNVYTMTVFCEELGTETISPDEEKIQIENFAPSFQYKDLIWNGKFKVGADGNIVADDTGDEISIGLINKVVNIDEKLSLTFTIATSNIKDSQLTGFTSITNTNLYCDACCELFRQVIKKAVKTSLENMRSKVNNFEDVETGDII